MCNCEETENEKKLKKELKELLNQYGSEKVLREICDIDPDFLKEYEREIGNLKMQLNYSRMY